MTAGAVLQVDAFTIITPSALDAAFRMGIPVRREGESSDTSRAGKKTCVWHRILETDGSYVVQVVNGQAQVTRLTDTGPIAFGTDSVQEHNQ